MRILIAPYSKKLREEHLRNPKNFPHWEEVLQSLHACLKCEIIQLGIEGEEKLKGADDYFFGLPIPELEKTVQECDIWATVDSYLPHMVHSAGGPPGVVVFSKSDPLVFGYPENINLLKDRRWLKPFQFDIWEKEPFEEESFVSADEVVQAILSVVSRRKK